VTEDLLSALFLPDVIARLELDRLLVGIEADADGIVARLDRIQLSWSGLPQDLVASAIFCIPKWMRIGR
jgi:hypothetical protein